MLVLTRKPQEVIQIGPHVTITIVRVSKNSVRIGVDAPQDLCVIRGELAADDLPMTRDTSRSETRTSSRPLRPASMLARVKSLTIVETPVESTRSDSRIADALSGNERPKRDEFSFRL